MASSTPALDALAVAGVAHHVHRYEHDPAAASYGEEAAAALGVPAERVFKTLVVVADEQLAVGVVPITSLLDLKAMARALGRKRVAMADPPVAERSSGYVVGGISPVGQKRRLPTIVDESARAAASIFVSGGRRGLEIELDPDDLLVVTGARYAPIARLVANDP